MRHVAFLSSPRSSPCGDGTAESSKICPALAAMTWQTHRQRTGDRYTDGRECSGRKSRARERLQVDYLPNLCSSPHRVASSHHPRHHEHVPVLPFPPSSRCSKSIQRLCSPGAIVASFFSCRRLACRHGVCTQQVPRSSQCKAPTKRPGLDSDDNTGSPRTVQVLGMYLRTWFRTGHLR